VVDHTHGSPVLRARQDVPDIERTRTRIKTWRWLAACVVLVAITWIPLLSVHLHRTTLNDADSGTVVVVFPPTRSSKAVFQSVIDAGGSMVRPVVWARHVWVVRSVEPGFAGRLRANDAWAVYSTDVLSADALLSCLRIDRGSTQNR
jgi:hypothetical protein